MSDACNFVLVGQIIIIIIIIRPDCGEVLRPNQQGCFSILERVGQLAIGGDDRGSSSIFVFVPTDFRCDATF